MYIDVYSLFSKGALFFFSFLFSFNTIWVVCRQALQLHKGDPAPVVVEIINTIEGGPPADVSSVRSM